MVHCQTLRLKYTHTLTSFFSSSGLYLKEEVIGAQQSGEQKYSVICQCSLDASFRHNVSVSHTKPFNSHTQLVYAHMWKYTNSLCATAPTKLIENLRLILPVWKQWTQVRTEMT